MGNNFAQDIFANYIMPILRKGGVIKLKPEAYEEYKKYHANVWPGVLAKLEEANIRNFTIYYSKTLGLLFSHFEYIENDLAADNSKIAADPETRRWWKIMEELFHNGWMPTQFEKK